MRKFLVLALAALLLAFVAPALAQDCSLATITGSYAFRYTGDSFLSTDLPFPPDPTLSPFPAHAVGIYAHGVIVGIMTIKADGAVDFKYWSTIGSWSSMRDGVTATGRIASLGLDQTPGGVALGCVGTVEYEPFGTGMIHKDKFFVLDAGREIRTVPFETPAFPTVASLGVARRITRSLDAAPRCNQNTARGSNLLTCPGPLYNPAGPYKTIGSAAVIDIRLLEGGGMTGTLHNRSASLFTSTHLDGGFLTNPDCTGEGWFESPDFAPGAKLTFMFVLYDEGKQGFALPLELYYEATGQTVAYPPVSCDMSRVSQ